MIPLVSAAGDLIGVLDLDSPVPGRFDDEDRAGLEAVAAVFVGTLTAMGVCLIAIKGRDKPREDLMLNLAGMCAPVVAMVPGPGIPAAPRALRLADYATLPRPSRCVRGRTIGVRVAKRSDVRSVTLAAGARKVFAKSGRRARLAFKGASMKVSLTVKLLDRRAVSQTYTFKRC